MSAESISINIQNTTNGVVPVSLLGEPNLADNANQFTQYRYDLTSLSITNEDFVSIQYRRVGASAYQTFVAELKTPTIQGVVNALNGLGVGSFFVTTSGGNTYVNNYDDSYEFGDLNVYNSASVPPVVNYSIATFSGSYSSYIDVNATNVVNEPNPASAAGVVPCSAGDSVTVYGITPIIVLPYTYVNVQVVNTTTSTVLFNGNYGAANGFTYTFSPLANNVYDIFILEATP